MTSMKRMTALVRHLPAMTALILLAACGGGSSDTATSAATSTSAGTSTAAAQSTVATQSTAPVSGADPLAFSASNFSVSEDGGSVSLTVNRTGPASAAVSVDFATTDGTALAGTDYSTATGTLQWAENDATSKAITVALLTPVAYQGVRMFSVALSNPSAAAQISNPDSATVTISGTQAMTAGSVQLSAATYSVSQSAGSLTVTVNRVAGTSGAISVGYATTDGTAKAGKDYTAATGSLSWADGDASSKTFQVAIATAPAFSGTSTFGVALSNVAVATLGTPGSGTVSIVGAASAPAGALRLDAASYVVAQNAGTVSVSVNRTGGSAGAVSVAYSTTGGSAVAGTDFTSSSGTLDWAAGDTAAKTFSVPINGTASFSGSRAFSLALSAPAGGATIGEPGSATVTISGDGSEATGVLQFSASSFPVAQSAGSLTVSVARTGGSAGAASVSYATQGGTAAAGSDFTAAQGTLKWTAGDAAAKTFVIAIAGATPFSGTKSFTVSLSQPAGASLGSPATAGVVISGSSAAAVGSLQLSAGTVAVAQGGGAAALTVNRTGGTSGAVSVAYATAAGTALAGTDFTATSGTLNWAAGDAASKTVSVPVSNARPFTGSKAFTLTLSAPGGGATLVTPSSATVTITGSGAVAGSGGPSAPANLFVTAQAASSISLSWSAASAGANAVASYKIYRNGLSYATSSTTSYVDAAATNATVPTYSAAATIYTYAVAAVDTHGNEGAQTTQTTFSVYAGGVFSWEGDYSYGVSVSYTDSAGAPVSGTHDIAVTSSGAGGGFQPFAGKVVPWFDMEAGAFGYVSMDLKPTNAAQVWRLSAISRLPPGDVYPWSSVSLADYGPAPVAGKWATYKIPLSALTVGATSFHGSIVGTKLTVTSQESGVGVDAGGFISGPGVAAGTYITGHDQNGGPGTYTIAPSQSVANTAMTEQRTSLYKLDLIDQTNASSNTYYVDNLKFTAN